MGCVTRESKPVERRYGVGRGKVFPAAKARQLLNPLRRVVQSPRTVIARAELAPAMRVLELGCGPGYFTVEVARAVPDGVAVAFDLQTAMLALASVRAPDAAPVNGDAMVLPFRDGAFDVALVVAMLGEVPDQQRCASELRRVLRPGGWLSIAETRRDSDFLRVDELRARFEPLGFAYAGRRGIAWEYQAMFRAT
jgi:ubiquinone/menaquinone biosynthesis C-methylase UbiE